MIFLSSTITSLGLNYYAPVWYFPLVSLHLRFEMQIFKYQAIRPGWWLFKSHICKGVYVSMYCMYVCACVCVRACTCTWMFVSVRCIYKRYPVTTTNNRPTLICHSGHKGPWNLLIYLLKTWHLSVLKFHGYV